MAPLLRAHFAPRQRSILSSLFAVTFLGAVLMVAFPCPARPFDLSRRRKGLIEAGIGKDEKEIVVMMNERSSRKFLEER